MNPEAQRKDDGPNAAARIRRSLSAGLRWLFGATLGQRLRRVSLALATCVVLPVLALVLAALCMTLPSELLERRPELSIRVEDREGQLLREVRTADGELSRWLALEQVPEFFQQALLAVEDQSFYAHPGVNPLALLRASGQWLREGHIVSGASTLTMQLARNLRPHPRTLLGKFLEMALALRIEAALSKPQILEQYCNRVDFGPNLRGVSAASHSYFARAPAELTRAELALLAGLPQSPSAYALAGSAGVRGQSRALQRRARVLARLRAEGVLSESETAELGSEALTLSTRTAAFGAPHFVSALMAGQFGELQPEVGAPTAPGTQRIRTTLDSELQRAAEIAVSRQIERLREHEVSAAAAILLDLESADVLAYVGSPDFYAERIQGQVNGARALRQPGSTLKPFVYAAAFEELGYTPATVLADTELRLETPQGQYAPRNYDDLFRGPVRLRDALANSINVPAVRTAIALGPDTLLRHLHTLGFDSLRESPEYYGPALALGDGEVTLLESVRAYGVLARGGQDKRPRAVLEVEANVASEPERRLLAPAQATQLMPAMDAASITDILKDRVARAQTFGRGSSLEFDFDVAVKTGTSKGYRDNWVVGYTDRYVLGVWVGNFDGHPMLNVGGAAGAAPIFASILQAAVTQRRPGALPFTTDSDARVGSPKALGLTEVEVCPLSGMPRSEACPRGRREWLPQMTLELQCDWHRRVAIDTRNGLLAGPACPSAFVRRSTFEYFPADFSQWARSVGRPLGPTASSPHCPLPEQSGSAQGLRIVSPLDGARFVLDPDRPLELQRLSISVLNAAEHGLPKLEIDEGPPLELDATASYDWPLREGEHTFVAVLPGGERSPPVRVTVRSAL